MGYTHYWYFPATYAVKANTWKKIVEDFNKILDFKELDGYEQANLRVNLRDILEQKSGQKLAITDDMIWFNGREENDQCHETFHLERKSTEESYRTQQTSDINGKPIPFEEGEECFTFCKTARKPYDIVVCCCLLIAKHYVGDLIKVSSDGDETEWNDAINLCKKHLGYNTFSFNHDGKLQENSIIDSLERQGVKLSL